MTDGAKRPMRLDDPIVGWLASLAKNAGDIETIAAVAGSQKPAASLFSFANAAGQACGVQQRAAYEILFAALNLRRLQIDQGVTEIDFFEDLTALLVDDLPESWTPETLQKWEDEVKSPLMRLLSSLNPDHPAYISQKAQSLAYTHQNILMAARLITDFRPVFDTAGEKILETVILHTLSVQYSSGHHEPSFIDFALDAEDVRSLREACDRAEKKTQASLTALENLNPVVYPERDRQ